ncbi:YkgJ family cysteine cluster protein [Magnetospirillum sp. UT-4]|uniref:YkgJ family cysteine cluster protein n=1 Tax=Magnetospirillum sp. UT-4 TaxID=2681467 RepID=UPI0013846E35|nr:YkgJ family cysteine cluster protein [Magnetospirillum sp. UT-4]CAA7613919.1 putative Lipoprotein [Magnetospirillum sp. UT-4]
MSDTPRTTEDEELGELDMEAMRPSTERDMEVEVFDAVRGQSAFPVDPVRLTPDDTFEFECHKGVTCWNKCCHGADITLTPNCILRLSKRLEITPAEFLLTYTVPAMHEKADLPIAKIKMGGDDGRGACPFNAAEGCTVYEDRPATCRFYPLGMVSVKMKDMDGVDDFFFLVKEDHCQGHCQTKSQNVGEFREEQGVEEYERVNRGWIDILMKAASWKVMGGPGGKAPSPQTLKMFFLATTDVQAFRRFVLESRFLQTYEVDDRAVEMLKTDDHAVLLLGYDWMKNVLFNEPTISMKEQVLQGAIAKARESMGAA